MQLLPVHVRTPDCSIHTASNTDWDLACFGTVKCFVGVFNIGFFTKFIKSLKKKAFLKKKKTWRLVMRISVGMRLTNVVLHLSPELMRLEIWGKSKINFKTMFIKEILL